MRINPGYVIGYNNLGLIHIKQGKLEDAVRLLSDIRKVKPNNAETCVTLGVALQAQSKTTEAIRYFSKAILINNIGATLARQGRYVEAAEYISKALKINPDYAKARYNLNAVLEQMKK